MVKVLDFEELGKIVRKYLREHEFAKGDDISYHVARLGYTHYVGRTKQYTNPESKKRGIEWKMHTGKATGILHMNMGAAMSHIKGVEKFSTRSYRLKSN